MSVTLINLLNKKCCVSNWSADTRQDDKYFNAMLGIGAASGHYYKRHLLPLGDYVPLKAILRGMISFFDLPMSDFSSGTAWQTGISLFDFKLASYICYEVAYPGEFFEQFPAASLIIGLSDNAWFGHSLAAAQQLQIAQLRSIETGRYQLVATDNGITAVIDPHGHVIKQLLQFKTGVLTSTVYAMNGTTPIISLGFPAVLFSFCALLFIALIYRPEVIIEQKNSHFKP